MQVIRDFNEYQILDMYDGKKIEKWNNIILSRPDPQIIWPKIDDKKHNIDATYNRSNKGGGSWTINNSKIPSTWQIHYHELVFNLKLMGFKHTGLFPEQAYNWNLIQEKIKDAKGNVKV